MGSSCAAGAREAGAEGKNGNAAAGSTSAALPSKTSLHVPQRTMPPRNFNWSAATRNIVLQWGHLVARAIAVLMHLPRGAQALACCPGGHAGPPSHLARPTHQFDERCVGGGHFFRLARQ